MGNPFSPYLWEVRNPVMLLSAMESAAMLAFTLLVLWRAGPRGFVRQIRKQPIILFALVFSLSFSFAVGISTYNFGSLVRYKIPMMPFFIMALFMIRYFTRYEAWLKAKEQEKEMVRVDEALTAN